MSTILALVQADKEGQIESKILKARQMEEIREARRAEQASKDEARRDALDAVKDTLRKTRKRKSVRGDDGDDDVRRAVVEGSQTKKSKRSVSFA